MFNLKNKPYEKISIIRCCLVAGIRDKGTGELDHRKDDLQHVGLFRVESFGEESHDQAFDFAPEHDDRAQDRRGVQREIEGESSHFGIDAQQFFGQLQMAAARYGQEFGQTLDDAQDDSLNGFHFTVLGDISVSGKRGLQPGFRRSEKSGFRIV